MIIIVGAALFLLVAFSLLYFAFYRPLHSHPFPGELDNVITAVATIQVGELKQWVSQEMSDFMADTLTPREQRTMKRRRRQVISDRLAPIEANTRLCLAFTRYQVRRLQRKPAGPRSKRDRLMKQLFERSQYCCLLLMFAKLARAFMAWDYERMLKFHRETVFKEVWEHLHLFLELSATYGEHNRNNLVTMMDAWELDEEAV